MGAVEGDNQEELWDWIMQCWEEMADQRNYWENLIDSMPERLARLRQYYVNWLHIPRPTHDLEKTNTALKVYYQTTELAAAGKGPRLENSDIQSEVDDYEAGRGRRIPKPRDIYSPPSSPKGGNKRSGLTKITGTKRSSYDIFRRPANSFSSSKRVQPPNINVMESVIDSSPWKNKDSGGSEKHHKDLHDEADLDLSSEDDDFPLVHFCKSKDVETRKYLPVANKKWRQNCASPYLPPDDEQSISERFCFLPLKTLASYYQLSELLKTKEIRSVDENFLQGIGGPDLKRAVRNALAKVLLDELAKEFNWRGDTRRNRLTKKVFGQTEIQQAFFSGIKSIKKFGPPKSIMDHDIKMMVTKWLSQAPECCQKAVARRQTQILQ
ncbi:hypothetical protein OUZ56_010683 [Daphnia magna]|uniref:DUF4806 domain-containing protein n=1 Tax=Daphnia magna TaxID=35525 RepID=A0ABR0AJM0_9CRUS|nr:hypothetical protein OUZ56_010683 [Daphnia magna]